MTIPNLDEASFRKLLRENLTPAKAISNPAHLRGRQAKLVQIDRAFNSPGKHAFVFGDRGVGKTSLAQSAAVLHQSSDEQPIIVACDQNAGFFSIVQAMARRCLPPEALIHKKKDTKGFSLKLIGLSAERGQAIEKGDVPLPSSINDAVILMQYICQFHSREPVVIVDEFDQLTSTSDRKYFADLIKQVSDQNVPLKFIFCGIGASLDELIGMHLSTDRYITPIELERLSHDARWEIVTSAAEALGVNVNRELYIRVGVISDGYPYYVHLMCEEIFWAMFDDAKDVFECTGKHFESGVMKAVEDAQTSLKFAYDKATQKYSDNYQEVLWAVADDAMLRRQVSNIYDKSYLRIMKERTERKTLDKNQFYNRMNSLKTDRHGKILLSKGAGWYEFRENVVRGYVRLRAAQQRIELGRDHFLTETQAGVSAS